jgi:hypothetical protein
LIRKIHASFSHTHENCNGDSGSTNFIKEIKYSKDRGKKDVQKGKNQRELQSIKPGYKLGFQIDLHPVRRKRSLLKEKDQALTVGVTL